MPEETTQAESPAHEVESSAHAPHEVDTPAGTVNSHAETVDTPASAVDSPGDEAESATAAAGPAAAAPAQRAMPSKLVFRTPGSAYVAIAFVLMSGSFVAVASPWYTLVYLLPVGAAVWVLRTRTEIDADKLIIRRVLTRTVLPWSKVASLRLTDRRWIRAVRTDGGEIPLPSVRTRHLPALALISGGRLTDPTDPDRDQGSA
ncbi:MAG TPA: PH domain-containing protein [Pseudonocardiaceae bacterium]|nr:PH domain-containing protein [Pseudonocardiaceae bacterium]